MCALSRSLQNCYSALVHGQAQPSEPLVAAAGELQAALSAVEQSDMQAAIEQSGVSASNVMRVLRHPDEILALGVIVAEELFGRSIPVVTLPPDGFDALACGKHARVSGGSVELSSVDEFKDNVQPEQQADSKGPLLTERDRETLEGKHGRAAQLAMKIVVRTATIQGAAALVDIEQAHIDGCTYIGPMGLKFAQTLVQLGGV